MDSFFYAFIGADFLGKLIFLSLFLLSILSWLFLMRKAAQLNKMKKGALHFTEAMRNKKVDSLFAFDVESSPKQREKEVDSPFDFLYSTFREKTAELLDKNLFFLTKKEGTKRQDVFLSSSDIELIASHLHTAITQQKEEIEKNLFLLSTTVTLAPFLGLLGTVWGILITFGGLQKGEQAYSSQLILGGLSTALTTTVLGLLIAIPALIGYSFLKNSGRSLLIEMKDFGHFLLSNVELHYRKVEP